MTKIKFSNKLKHDFQVWETLFIHNNDMLLLIGECNTLKMLTMMVQERTDDIHIEIKETSIIETLKDNRSYRRGLVINNNSLCVCSFSGNIHFYSYNPTISSFEYKSLLEGPKAELKSLSTNSDNTLICAASRDKNVWIWKLSSDTSTFYKGFKDNSDTEPEYECFYILQGHTGDVKRALFVNPQNTICSVSYTGEVIFWVLLDESDANSDEWVSKEVIKAEQNAPTNNNVFSLLSTKIKKIDSEIESINSLTCHPEKKVSQDRIYEDKTNTTLWNVKSFKCENNFSNKDERLVFVVGENSTIMAFFLYFDRNKLETKIKKLPFDLNYVKLRLGYHTLYDLELIYVENNIYKVILVGNILAVLTINVFEENILIESIESIQSEIGIVINIDRSTLNSSYFILTSNKKETQLMKVC